MPLGERGGAAASASAGGAHANAKDRRGDLYLRFVVEFPGEEASAAWGEEERQALQDLLPPKPKFPKEKPVRFFCVCLRHGAFVRCCATICSAVGPLRGAVRFFAVRCER